MYKKQWTQFETQSLAFGLLRKALYPKYLVRGDTGVITIYRPTLDKQNPELCLTIRVKASESIIESGFFKVDENEYHMVGGDQAYKAADLVLPLLFF